MFLLLFHVSPDNSSLCSDFLLLGVNVWTSDDGIDEVCFYVLIPILRHCHDVFNINAVTDTFWFSNIHNVALFHVSIRAEQQSIKNVL